MGAVIRSVTIQKEVMSASAGVVSRFLVINTNATVSQKNRDTTAIPGALACGTIYPLCLPI